jgi:hypothetical protein
MDFHKVVSSIRPCFNPFIPSFRHNWSFIHAFIPSMHSFHPCIHSILHSIILAQLAVHSFIFGNIGHSCIHLGTIGHPLPWIHSFWQHWQFVRSFVCLFVHLLISEPLAIHDGNPFCRNVLYFVFDSILSRVHDGNSFLPGRMPYILY